MCVCVCVYRYIYIGIYIYRYKYIYRLIYIYERGACAQIHTYIHRVNFFVANPNGKEDTKLSLCEAAYLILMPDLICITNSILKTAEAISYLSRNESSKTRFVRKELNACCFWVVPAGDIIRTYQRVERTLHFIFEFPAYIPRTPVPDVSNLAKRQSFKSSAKNMKVFVFFPNPNTDLVLTQPSKLHNWQYEIILSAVFLNYQIFESLCSLFFTAVAASSCRNYPSFSFWQTIYS